MKKEIRAFIATEIHKETRKELIAVQEKLKKSLKGNIAWVKPENIHLTLRFLGHIEKTQIEQFKKIITAITKQIKKFYYDLGVIGAFPSLSNPRVIWVGINFGFNELNQINALLEEQLEIIDFGVGEKYFHPHLTIARVKTLQDKGSFEEISKQIRPHQEPYIIDKIVLFESELSSKGAKYTKLFESKLS